MITVHRFDIGRRVTAARVASGLTRNQLANMTEITHQTLTRIEDGDVFQRVDLLGRIASVLDVSLNWLVWGNHPPKANRELMAKLVKHEMRCE